MNLIDLIALSEKRSNILLLLEKKPGSFEEIEGLLDMSSASLRFHIKKLLDFRLLEKEGGEYKLSGMAMPIIENLKVLMDSLAFFEENMDYWKKHDLTPVPDFLLRRLEELGRFELTEPDATQIPQVILKYLRASEEIFAFFSYLHPEILFLYSEFAKKGLRLSLCVTEPIAERLFNDFPIETKILLEAENTKMFVCSRDVHLPVCVVTDRFMAIGFFLIDGSPSNQFAISSEARALNWGKELYRHYYEISKYIDTENLKPVKI